MVDLKALWHERTQVEQRYIIGGTALFAVLLLFFGAWLPAMDRHRQLTVTVDQLKEDVIWMRGASSTLLRKGAGANRTLEETLQMVGRPPMRRLASDKGGQDVVVRFKKIRADRLFAWLDTVRHDTLAVVSKASIEALEDSGWVSARLHFKEPR